MAQRVQIVLEDDLDGGVAAETVTFGLDGVNYEIDLSDKNAGKLRDEFATWIGHARRSGGRRTSGRRASTGPSSSSGRRVLSAVRAWARSNGHTVPERGRIPSSVREAFEAAN